MIHLPHHEVIPVLDFGSQYAQLIARRVREAGAFSLLVAPDTPIETLKQLNPKGVILSGGPASVYEDGAPRCDEKLFELGVPVLGICYGMQIACQILGCQVDPAEAREYGRAQLHIADHADLLHGVPEQTSVWMSHGDQLSDANHDFNILATTPTCPYAAVRHKSQPFYGVQFHPEVTHTPHGVDILHNFLYEICGCNDTWRMSDFMDQQVKAIREEVGDARVSAKKSATPASSAGCPAGSIHPSSPRCWPRRSVHSSRASSSTTACCAKRNANSSNTPSAATSTSTCA